MILRRVLAGMLSLLAGCASAQRMPAVDEVNIPRFMGAWYVIASIPSPPERDSYDAIETYRLAKNGEIDTTLRYRKGGLDEPLKTLTSTAFIDPDSGNARWQVQFFWPLRFEYVVAYLDPDYQTTIIARSKRDYAWIMARRPHLSDATYAALVEKLQGMGYDVGKLRRVPFPPSN